MLMRIIRTRAKPGKWPQFERDFFDNSPDLEGVPGTRGRWILHDLDDREAGFVVALWESEVHAIAFERASERNQLLANPLPGEFEFHMCEIRCAWIAPDTEAGAARSLSDLGDRSEASE